MVDGLEPHGIFTQPYGPRGMYSTSGMRGGVYPGWWGLGGWVGTGEGYTGYYPGTLPDPKYSIFKARGPTHGQMNGISEVSMRFLRKGPERVPE